MLAIRSFMVRHVVARVRVRRTRGFSLGWFRGAFDAVPRVLAVRSYPRGRVFRVRLGMCVHATCVARRGPGIRKNNSEISGKSRRIP